MKMFHALAVTVAMVLSAPKNRFPVDSRRENIRRSTGRRELPVFILAWELCGKATC